MGALGIPELVIIFGFIVLNLLWLWMLIDCAVNEPSGNDKIVWIVIIVFTGCIGGVIYFFVRRPRRIDEFGQ